LNVWALHKDIHLKHFMLILLDTYGPGSVMLSKLWQEDTKAIGIYNPGNESLLAYVHTHGQAHGRFGVHLHYPAFAGDNTSAQEGLELNALVELVSIHLDLVNPH
jgi:hypothetical protein